MTRGKSATDWASSKVADWALSLSEERSFASFRDTAREDLPKPKSNLLSSTALTKSQM